MSGRGRVYNGGQTNTLVVLWRIHWIFFFFWGGGRGEELVYESLVCTKEREPS